MRPRPTTFRWVGRSGGEPWVRCGSTIYRISRPFSTRKPSVKLLVKLIWPPKPAVTGAPGESSQQPYPRLYGPLGRAQGGECLRDDLRRGVSSHFRHVSDLFGPEKELARNGLRTPRCQTERPLGNYRHAVIYSGLLDRDLGIYSFYSFSSTSSK